MQHYSQAYQSLRQSLMTLYDQDEATAIAREVMLVATGKSYLQNIGIDAPVSNDEEIQLRAWGHELATGRPMQYVLEESWFLGRKYFVDERVLIPRPETEELVQWIIDDCRNSTDAPSILDIGTGSGCIPISLKLAMKRSVIAAYDISGGALEVAHKNAATYNACIHFVEMDFLDKAQQNQLGKFDIIVSNPPYIPVAEQAEMHRNVKDFEPSNALFVPDNDPQRFYRAIAPFGKEHLYNNGIIYCELHRDYAADTAQLFRQSGYHNIELRQDINRHPRILKAIWSV